MRAAALVGFLVSVLAIGEVSAKERAFAEFRGWTADGRSAVYVIREAWTDPESGAGGERVTGHVVDARTGEARRFLADAKPSPSEQKRAAKEKLGSAAELEAWIAAHPLEKLPGRSSRDGASRARIDLAGDDALGAWKDATFSFGPKGGEDAMLTDAKMTFAVERGGKTYPGWRWQESSAGNLNGTVVPHWSPDGHRVAWVLTRGYAMMNDAGYGRVGLSAAGPSVELLAPKGAAPAAADAASDALERAGLYPVKRGEAQKARDKSAVYFAPGFETEAKAAAAALPGGASVEKLTWKVDTNLVVALGKSAEGT